MKELSGNNVFFCQLFSPLYYRRSLFSKGYRDEYPSPTAGASLFHHQNFRFFYCHLFPLIHITVIIIILLLFELCFRNYKGSHFIRALRERGQFFYFQWTFDLCQVKNYQKRFPCGMVQQALLVSDTTIIPITFYPWGSDNLFHDFNTQIHQLFSL